ncbi:MAG: metalloregulator ArsR/SmtB family transcription factor [Rhodospirillales bacterium]|jgi:rhodanese-related sulfurtransferase/DNA-binding transcriptional ArsR family regulator|nr:ArsR family transcriptional regulator [Rhodospirillaceae bacterium]MDP6643606.1 metalloregulator ArsR/SmtB family transcription factor [Rhodospirillales bacterium]MDP6842290.1 metalloregulator ArsR/SmtB family transcription factor [Rhodospirillales bacterium]|tara:strand:- start:773 stop:1447 length:675 start_codon:yes stop_codon:yes gene_type:complete
MSSTSAKHQLLEQFASVAKALGHVHRLDLVEYLAQGERSVEALAQVAGLTVANTSQHLQNLRRAGLVISHKRGLHVFYSLAGEDVIGLLRALRQTTERHIAEVDRIVSGYFNERDNLEPVSRKELLARTKEGLVTVLDVRPPEEYQAGHIPGAVNLPLGDLKKRLKDLPKGQQVIAYCRGPYCVLAFEAVAALRKKGFDARRLEEGYPEWKASGLPVEADASGA